MLATVSGEQRTKHHRRRAHREWIAEHNKVEMKLALAIAHMDGRSEVTFEDWDEAYRIRTPSRLRIMKMPC
jgi:Mg-chelatase subunit ChlI